MVLKFLELKGIMQTRRQEKILRAIMEKLMVRLDIMLKWLGQLILGLLFTS